MRNYFDALVAAEALESIGTIRKGRGVMDVVIGSDAIERVTGISANGATAIYDAVSGEVSVTGGDIQLVLVLTEKIESIINSMDDPKESLLNLEQMAKNYKSYCAANPNEEKSADLYHRYLSAAKLQRELMASGEDEDDAEEVAREKFNL